MSLKNPEILKIKQSTVRFKEDGEEDKVTVIDTGTYFDIELSHVIIRLTYLQWEAVKKAAKSLKKGKKNRVVEEPESSVEDTSGN